MDERCELWPAAQSLRAEQVQNCRVLPSRYHLLDVMPKNDVCAEVGVWTGNFSAEILQRTTPKQLHLIDIDPRWLDAAAVRFSDEVAADRVVTHAGDSSSILRSMPIGFFDWVYIDGDHTYEGCKKDLEAAAERLKPGGTLAMNDYTFWGPSDFCKYGVMEAVNEFCLAHGFEFIYLALQGRGYHDVAIRELV